MTSRPKQIDEFVTCVFRGAKARLREIDPKYVALIEEIARAHTSKLAHPAWDPKLSQEPSHRLPSEWYELLESALDLGLQVDFVLHALRQLAAASSVSDVNERGKATYFYFRAVITETQALVEKAQVCSIRAVRRTSQSQSDKQVAQEAVKKQLMPIQGRLEKMRDPQLHGAGGSGLVMRGITEDGLWDVGVAASASLEIMTNGIYDNQGIPLTILRRHRQSEKVTALVFEVVGKTLADVASFTRW